ncbi:MAG: cell envelope biogenesis protein TolA [Pseudomonadota bacterium]
MSTGAYISGVAHALLILGLLFGGLFTRSRMPDVVSVADVSVISAQEFAALTAPDVAPSVTSDTAEPDAPETEAAPEIAALSDTAPEVPQISQPDAPESDTPADQPPDPAQQEAEISDTLPPQEAPPVPDDRPDAPVEATPAPAPRVAPQVAPAPPPDVEDGPEVVEDTAPAPSPEPPQPEEAPQAPEEATTEIVTEAETPTLAPSSAPRPRTRPPVRQAGAEPEPEPEPDPALQPSQDAIADAVAEAVANSQSDTPAAPSGPPLSFGEREAFRVAVSGCWDVDVGGRSADVTVTVAFDLNQDGTVVGNQVRQVSATGGDSSAQRTAYEKARRAILRCQRGGFPLPPDKYATWRQIEITFNPEGMRLR